MKLRIKGPTLRLRLTQGEMRALQWTDVDLDKGQLRVERNEWQGHITSTKGNRLRYVPMTSRLREALRAHRHLRGARVLYRDDGGVLTESALREAIARAARRATCEARGRTCCITRSARIWRCGAQRRARYRNSQGIAISGRRSGTCT